MSTKRSKIGTLYANKKKKSGDGAPSSSTLPEMAQRQYDSFVMMAEKHAIEFDDDPLIWWCKFKDLAPELSQLVRKYLGIRATSCASERLFSKQGFIVNDYRSSLKPENVSMLTFIAANTSD